MPIVLAQVTLGHVSGLAEHNIVNTFHFDSDGTDTEAALIAGKLVDFYNTAPTVGYALRAYLSDSLTRAANGCTIKFYNLAEPEPRVPYYDQFFTLGVGLGAEPMPSEVACCLSYRALPTSGAPAARRRGRLYIGPLNNAAADSPADVSRPLLAFRDCLLYIGVRLGEQVDDLGATWGVYSRVSESLSAIRELYVDNSWDTQRRRGEAPTGRDWGYVTI